MAHGEELRNLAYFAVNKLPDADYMFASSPGSWAVSAGSATISVDAEEIPYSGGQNSLRIVPANTSDFTVVFDDVTTDLDDRRDDIMFHALFKSNSPFRVQIDISSSGLTDVSRTVSVPAGRWVTVRSLGIDIPDTEGQNFDLSFSLTFSDHSSSTPIYLAYPTVMPDFAFMDNLFVRESIPLLPEVLVVKDSEQTFPSFPMSRLADVGATYSGLAFEQFLHFRYRDLASGKNVNDQETLSGLVDVDVSDGDYLPWLSQFVGVNLTGAKSGTTPWDNLVGTSDTALTTWADLMAEADTDGFDSIDLTDIDRVAGGDVTATVASGDWPSPAPEVGDTVIIAGTTSFDGQYEINSVSAGTYEVVFNDGVEWGSLTRDASGDVVGYIKSDGATKYLGYPPNWAQVGTLITISGVADTSFNGTFTITAVNDSANTIEWNDGQTSAASDSTGYGSYVVSEAATGSITQVDSSWLDLELYDLATSSLVEFHRDQIKYAYGGFKGGSLDSLTQAVKQFLRDTKTVEITQHYGGDEWAILVETLTAETPNGLDDTAAEVVTDLIDLSKPAGYVVTHFCRASL
jgi:hypothetical protein